MNTLGDKIKTKMHQAQMQGLLRTRRAVQLEGSVPNQILLDGVSYRNFASNDYLGLSQSRNLIEAMAEGARRFGVGSGASPLVTGYSDAHQALEQALCEHTGHQAAILFSSGFSANNALMKTLFDADSSVLADKLIHASLIDGLLESGAKLKRFAHNDLNHAAALADKCTPHALITESVFSMDGDVAPIDALYSLARHHGSWLIVDDAHGFGVLPGHSAQVVDASCCDLQVVTFGKALGCQGAAILGTKAGIDFLVANARDYIYSTALSPANAFVALQAVKLVTEDNKLALCLAELVDYFRQRCAAQGIALGNACTPIQPIVIGSIDSLMRVSEYLKGAGFWVGVIRPPTVPQGSARLRITLNLGHSHEDIDALVDCLSQALSV